MRTSWWMYLGILIITGTMTLTVDHEILRVGAPFALGGILVGILLSLPWDEGEQEEQEGSGS